MKHFYVVVIEGSGPCKKRYLLGYRSKDELRSSEPSSQVVAFPVKSVRPCLLLVLLAVQPQRTSLD